jgi:hypothetical protein
MRCDLVDYAPAMEMISVDYAPAMEMISVDYARGGANPPYINFAVG